MAIELPQDVMQRLQSDHYGWLNLDSDGHGSGIIVVGGVTTVDAEGADPREDAPYWAKYADDAERIGLADSMDQYGLRLRISIDKVWTTPTPG